MTSYVYNPAHELLTTQGLGAAPTTFAYDTTGLRRKRAAGGSTSHFLWDRVNLLADLDGDLARTAQYTDFPGVWGGLSSQRRNGTSRYFAFDLSANTRALLDGGAVTDSYLYRAFGVEEAVAGSTVNVLRFGGQVGYYRDLADRLYVRARHYRPGMARWVSRDPLLATHGATLTGIRFGPGGRYTYAAGVQRLDPLGLVSCEDWRGTSNSVTTIISYFVNFLGLVDEVLEWLKKFAHDIPGASAALAAIVALVDCLLGLIRSLIDYSACMKQRCEQPCPAVPCEFCPPVTGCAVSVGLALFFAALLLAFPEVGWLPAALTLLSMVLTPLIGQLTSPFC